MLFQWFLIRFFCVIENDWNNRYCSSRFLNFLVLRVALAGSGRYTVCERFGRFERSL